MATPKSEAEAVLNVVIKKTVRQQAKAEAAKQNKPLKQYVEDVLRKDLKEKAEK